MSQDVNVTVYLDLIAAKAALLAAQQKDGKLWPGDLRKGLQDIASTTNEVMDRIRDDR